MVYSREKKVNKDALVLINVNSSFFYFLTNLGPMSLAILLKHENLFILICPGWGLNSDLWDYKLPIDPPLLVSNFVNFLYFLYFFQHDNHIHKCSNSIFQHKRQPDHKLYYLGSFTGNKLYNQVQNSF